MSQRNDCDLLIIGAGPAGLAAAINGASEGLSVCLLDSGASLGGQAKESNSIENYPLPESVAEGVTGEALVSGFVAQATKFGAHIYAPTAAALLTQDKGRHIITTDDYHEFSAKAVILSLGLAYRRHGAKNLSRFMGRGVFYGLPASAREVKGKRKVGIIGGANSAGQAALKLSQNGKAHVYMFVRRSLKDQMSQYLIDRIHNCKNVTVYENADVTEANGVSELEGVTYKQYQRENTQALDDLFIFIGAHPRTLWLNKTVAQDDHRFILTDADLAGLPGYEGQRIALPYETSIPGVFAAGDVRRGSTKRITGAIGEGVGALQSVYRYLNA